MSAPVAPVATGATGADMAKTIGAFHKQLLKFAVTKVEECQQIEVVGAGTEGVNGVYHMVGERKNGAAQYRHVSGDLSIGKCEEDRWFIGDTTSGRCAGKVNNQDDFYVAKAKLASGKDTAAMVPTDGWEAFAHGVAPNPKVVCTAHTTTASRRIYNDKSCAAANVLLGKCPAENGCILKNKVCRSTSAVKLETAQALADAAASDKAARAAVTTDKPRQSEDVDYASTNKKTVSSDLGETSKTQSTQLVDYDKTDKKSKEASKAGLYLVDASTGLKPTLEGKTGSEPSFASKVDGRAGHSQTTEQL
jgi:hypothetical protein